MSFLHEEGHIGAQILIMADMNVSNGNQSQLKGKWEISHSKQRCFRKIRMSLGPGGGLEPGRAKLLAIGAAIFSVPGDGHTGSRGLLFSVLFVLLLQRNAHLH